MSVAPVDRRTEQPPASPPDSGSSSGDLANAFAAALAQSVRTDAGKTGPQNRPDGSSTDAPPANETEALDDIAASSGTSQVPVDATTLETPLQMAQDLSANWGAWGMHQGVSFGAPPASLPQHAKDVLSYFNQNPTLLNAIVQGNGGKPGDAVTLAAVNNYIGSAKQDAVNADTELNYTQTDGLTMPNGLGSSTENTLNPTIAYAAQLTANWHTWGLHSGIDFNNPPADLPQQAKDVLGYFSKNPGLLDTIVAASGGKPGDPITQSAVDAYLSKAVQDTQSSAALGGTGTPSTELAEAQLLNANWNTWGLHQGIDFNNPPTDLPQQAQDTIKYFAQNPTLYNAIVQGNGGQAGGTITQAAVQAFIKTAAGEASDAAGANPGAAAWSSLTQGMDPSTQTQLNAPLQAASDLAANWDAWGMHQGVDFANPPADLPQQAKDDLKTISQNPALLKALDAGGNGTADGTITLNDVKGYVSHASDDVKAAGKDYSDWLTKNPEASASSKELARQAAVVMANQTLISAANPDDKAAVNGNVTADDLKAIAANPTAYGTELSQAAGLFSNPGMFQLLDTAGDDPATSKPDGIYDSANIAGWLKSGAPVSDADFGNLMTQAGSANAAAGVDTSKLGPDVFANPGNYTGQQKAAVLQQLQQTYQKLQAGQSEGLWPDAGTSQYPKLNPNETKVASDLMAHITQLSQDPDVQSYMETNGSSSLQGMINNDADLKGTVQASYNDFKSGATLTADLAQKDKDGNTVTLQAGLATFVQQGNFFSQALGSNGQPLDVGMPAIVQNSSQYQAIQSTYLSQIVSGKELTDALASGTDPSTALQQFAGDVATFSAVLPPDMVQQNTAALQQNYANAVSDQVLDSGTSSELNLSFADSKGNLDDGKLNALIQQIQQQSPDLFKDENGNPVAPDKIVNAFKQVWDEVRGGAKVSDALAKLNLPNIGNPTVQGLYGKGVLHAVSALFAGGVLAGKAAEGANSPTADVSIAASAATLLGTTMEASTKYASKTPAANPAGLTADQLKQIENSGKIVGGLGSIAGGVLGIISGVGEIAGGDKVNGGFALAGGITGILAGGTSIADGGVALAGTLGVTGLADLGAGLAAVAGGLSIVTAAIGFIGLIVYGFVELAKQDKKEDQFQGEVLPVLDQYGITGGPVTPSDEPVNPIPSSGD